MKVLFISRLYPNEYSHRNGAVIHRQALELVKKGVEIEVICPVPIVPRFLKNKRTKWKEYYSLPLVGKYEGITVYYPRFLDLPSNLYKRKVEKNIINSFKKMEKEKLFNFTYDIIHSHMAYPDSSLGLYLKDKYDKPLLTTIRSTDMMLSIHDKVIKNKMNYNLLKSEMIISPSPQLSKKLEREFNQSSFHIGNGIYPFSISGNYEDSALEGKKVLLSISQLITWKGIENNILAMRELVNMHSDLIYIIIGDGPNRAHLEALVDMYKLRGNIFFYGDLSHDEAMYYLSKSDIFSLPSYRETFGLVYLEAMYLEKPVILCDGNGIDGIVSSNESAMIIRENNTDDLVEAIDLLLTNNELYEKVVSAGRDIVINNYLWENIGEKLIEVYNKQIKGGDM